MQHETWRHTYCDLVSALDTKNDTVTLAQHFFGDTNFIVKGAIRALHIAKHEYAGPRIILAAIK
jgi:hypothetical protein